MEKGRQIRILIVDDSAVMRSLVRSAVGKDLGIEVAGTAGDGESALRAIASLRPDLVLLDVEMPVMDGLATLKEMRARGHKVPVIMCSSLTQRGAKVTIEALANGASDYVAKPANQSGREAATQTLSQQLIPKIRALTARSQAAPSVVIPGAGLGGAFGIKPAATRIPAILSLPAKSQAITSAPQVVVIGVSTGGPAALDILLPMLPANFRLPVMIVQHMPELFTRIFAERLNNRCPMTVLEAKEGQPLQPGTVYIAKGNWHMEILPSSRIASPAKLHLTQDPLENHCRPAVDVLFRSAARVYASGVLAVVLTGMGSDGLAGSRIIREHGGTVLAQDQETSVIWGMPGAVAQAGLAQNVLPLKFIANEIVRLVCRSKGDACEALEPAV
jgi:two-component system, chemotaxis family, protein-glutamate methylesterase/glutaminase